MPTHCDLKLGNIIVRDRKAVSIHVSENTAFFPTWYEYVSASFGFTDMDVESKMLLRGRLDAYGEAHEMARHSGRICVI